MISIQQLRWLRWAARATLMLGVTASVVANVLHAEPNPIARCIAAWPPVALLITVELIAWIPVHRRSLAAARLGATATLAGIAAWVSYWHMAGVAGRYGETGASPYLLPLSVDGLVVVASISLVELAGRIGAVAAELAPPGEPAPMPEPAVVSAAGGDPRPASMLRQVDFPTGPEKTPAESAPQADPDDVTIGERGTYARRQQAAPAASAYPVVTGSPRKPVVQVDADTVLTGAEVAAHAQRWAGELLRLGRTVNGPMVAARYGLGERWSQVQVQKAKEAHTAARRTARERESAGV